jgi:hypothetical protein
MACVKMCYHQTLRNNSTTLKKKKKKKKRKNSTNVLFLFSVTLEQYCIASIAHLSNEM